MIKRITQLAGAAAVSLAAVTTASADIKLNDNFSVSGYVVGGADSTSVDESENVSTMDHKASKLATKINFAPVSGTFSFYSGSDNSPVVLDAFMTYDLGGGSSITAGKFLSWLGYEAFDPINMVTITYAWAPDTGALGGIPAYHSGVKFETGNDSFGAGFAVLDSNESMSFTSPVHKGDGDLDNGAGLEGYFTYKTKALTVFLGGSYNSHEDDTGADANNKQYSGDLWVQYVTGDMTLAGEFCYGKLKYETGPATKSYFAGFWARYAASDKVAFTGRIATGKIDTGATDKPTYMKYTFAPSFSVTGNLEVIGEASYTTYDKMDPVDSSTYYGVQARFKF